MNLAMWQQALRMIPPVSLEDWNNLDLVSKWLLSSRAAVLVMTLISSILAGLFAIRDNVLRHIPWLVLTMGRITAGWPKPVSSRDKAGSIHGDGHR